MTGEVGGERVGERVAIVPRLARAIERHGDQQDLAAPVGAGQQRRRAGVDGGDQRGEPKVADEAVAARVELRPLARRVSLVAGQHTRTPRTWPTSSSKAARKNLCARLVRLDPTGSFRALYRDELRLFLGHVPEGRSDPPLLSFAVGGAGAQADMVELFLPRMRPAIEAGRLRLALIAGTRREVAAYFRAQIHRAGLEGQLGGPLRIVAADTVGDYFAAFNALLAETDILYTKPSELSFFAALGIPLVCARPVGEHEKINRRFLLEAGAGFKQWDPRHAAQWLDEWLLDGTLAAGAWSGFMRLPKTGTHRIVERFTDAR